MAVAIADESFPHTFNVRGHKTTELSHPTLHLITAIVLSHGQVNIISLQKNLIFINHFIRIRLNAFDYIPLKYSFRASMFCTKNLVCKQVIKHVNYLGT